MKRHVFLMILFNFLCDPLFARAPLPGHRYELLSGVRNQLEFNGQSQTELQDTICEYRCNNDGDLFFFLSQLPSEQDGIKVLILGEDVSEVLNHSLAQASYDEIEIIVSSIGELQGDKRGEMWDAIIVSEYYERQTIKELFYRIKPEGLILLRGRETLVDKSHLNLFQLNDLISFFQGHQFLFFKGLDDSLSPHASVIIKRIGS